MTTETKSFPGVARCHRRVDHLFSLVGGPDNLIMSLDAVEVAHALIDMTPSLAKAYHIVPYSRGGGILLEFMREGWDYAIEIRHDGILDVYGIEIGSLRRIDFETASLHSPEFQTWLNAIAP